MDLNQRPQKTLPLKFQDPTENITSGSKRPAKSQNMEIDYKPEEKKIKIHDVIKPEPEVIKKKVNKIAKNQLPNIDKSEKFKDNLKPEVDSVESKSEQKSIDNKVESDIISNRPKRKTQIPTSRVSDDQTLQNDIVDHSDDQKLETTQCNSNRMKRHILSVHDLRFKCSITSTISLKG